MDISVFRKLHIEGLISDASFEKIKIQSGKQLFSLHWELKTILYLGVLLLTSGVGVLVYKNIDAIGHQVILLLIGLTSAVSFLYCFRRKQAFSFEKVESPDSFLDYILLLGCLTFVTFVGYLQFQFNLFGERYGLATFIPMVVLFFTAYYFDHIGVVSLAITNLAAWAGITVTPAKILKDNDFNSSTIIITGILLGVFLILAGNVTQKRKIKPHFEFTYTNFGSHLLFISCLAAMFHFNTLYFLWFIILIAICYFFYIKAIRQKSFYFLLILTLYAYIGISYVIMKLIFDLANLEISGAYMAFMYFIASAIGIIIFLMRMNKKIKTT
jgi:hypothetical protein